MEIHLKAWPHTKTYEGLIEQPCVIDYYKLHYPFMPDDSSYPRRVVWNWESRNAFQSLYFNHKTVHGLPGALGNFYFHIYVSRKFDISTLYWNTTIPNADTTPPPTMLEYFNKDERKTWGMTDSPIRKHHGFFANDENVLHRNLNLPLRKVKNGWIQTETECAPRIPKLGAGDVDPSTEQIILFEKIVLATCSMDDDVVNDMVITPRIKKIPSFMFCSSLEDARKNLNFSFLFPHANWIDETSEIKFIFDLKYEY